jgi:ribosome-associated toxin RatA of RatAB toxin-antitoxin module
MPIVKTSILINAPADKIFDTMADPEGIPKWAPIESVSNITGSPGEMGSSADYTLRVFGIKLKQTMTVLQVDKPYNIVYKMAGGFPGKWTYTLKTEDNGARVSAEVHYKVRGGVIGNMINKILLQRMHQRKTELFTIGLKTFCES